MSSAQTARGPEADKLDSSPEASSNLDLEKEKQTVESKDPSTGTPSTTDTETEKKDIIAADSGAVTSDEAAVAASFPSGIKLAFIVTALVLSVFLFSLDQVSFYHSKVLT
jgi:hypothetical protein